MTGLEKLRAICGLYYLMGGGVQPVTIDKLKEIADQIERETLPRPLFEDGEPVQFGDEFVAWNGTVGTVSAINVVDNARLIIINSSSSNNYIVGAKDSHGRFAKRPEPHDTWERIEADARKFAVFYCDERGLLDPMCNTLEGDASTRHCTDCGCSCEEKMALDLVRRCKELAGVE